MGLYALLHHQVHLVKMGARYEATLDEGIDFTKPGYPLFLKNVSGLSNPENWGRWSDAKDAGPTVMFEFRDPLPQRFMLMLALKAYGPNQQHPIKVKVGNTVTRFSLNPNLPSEQIQTVKLDITQNTQEERSSIIEIVAPTPTAPPKPANFNPSYPIDTDLRLLGIGMSAMQIYDKTK